MQVRYDNYDTQMICSIDISLFNNMTLYRSILYLYYY